jgi:hypothetical protein
MMSYEAIASRGGLPTHACSSNNGALLIPRTETRMQYTEQSKLATDERTQCQ